MPGKLRVGKSSPPLFSGMASVYFQLLDSIMATSSVQMNNTWENSRWKFLIAVKFQNASWTSRPSSPVPPSPSPPLVQHVGRRSLVFPPPRKNFGNSFSLVIVNGVESVTKKNNQTQNLPLEEISKKYLFVYPASFAKEINSSSSAPSSRTSPGLDVNQKF